MNKNGLLQRAMEKVCQVRGKHGPFIIAKPSGRRFCRACGKGFPKET